MAANVYRYAVILDPDGDAFNVRVPDIPEAITCGFSETEALEYAVDAIELALSEYIRKKKELPTPAVRKGKDIRIVVLPALTQAKLALYSELLNRGIRKAELARRLGWSKNQVERLFDLKHASRIDQIEEALRSLGKHMFIAVSAA